MVVGVLVNVRVGVSARLGARRCGSERAAGILEECDVQPAEQPSRIALELREQRTRVSLHSYRGAGAVLVYLAVDNIEAVRIVLVEDYLVVSELAVR